VDTTAARNPAVPPLLVRRADPAGERDVVALVRDVPVDPEEVVDLMRHHGVLVLSDLSLPPTAPPFAAAAFRLDRTAGIVQLAGIGVRAQPRGQGLGRRLLTGAAASLLASAGSSPSARRPRRTRRMAAAAWCSCSRHLASGRARTEQRLTSAKSDRAGLVHLGVDGQDAFVAYPRPTRPGLSPPAGPRATT